ncbi:hypothetical protein [Methylocystis sp. ATCC 49242]|uniref:hypothetical protein n=1 Tax=Methylocystis sp. ATCC 49242 TaxID=622637 RepID=UPI0001F87108|nr:hypothetical protein [Methylocystis sp. ATCC 49242]
MATYKSPTGSLIIGTSEIIPGIALIYGISETGEPEYVGETKLYWDAQHPETRDGKTLFLDEDGQEWTFDQLVKEENADDHQV